MLAREALPRYVHTPERVLGQVGENEGVGEREPPVALTFRQGEVLGGRVPRRVVFVPPRAVVVGVVPQRDDPRRIERDPKRFAHLAAPRRQEIVTVLGFAAAPEERPSPGARGLSAVRRCSSTRAESA